MSKAPDRFSDGFQVIIGDTIDFDSEAEAYGAPSKVGQKYKPTHTSTPAQSSKPRKVSKEQRAKLRKLMEKKL